MKKYIPLLFLLCACGNGTNRTVTHDTSFRYIVGPDAYAIFKTAREINNGDTTYQILDVDFTRPIIDSATGKQKVDSLGNKFYYKSYQPIDKRFVGNKLKGND